MLEAPNERKHWMCGDWKHKSGNKEWNHVILIDPIRTRTLKTRAAASNFGNGSDRSAIFLEQTTCASADAFGLSNLIETEHTDIYSRCCLSAVDCVLLCGCGFG